MERADHRSLLIWRDPPKDAVALHNRSQSFEILREVPSVNHMLTPRNSYLPSDRCHRLGMVTGNDFGCHALLSEESEGAGSVLTDGVTENDEGCWFEVGGEVLFADEGPCRIREQQHATTLRRVRLGLGEQAGVCATHNVWGAKHPRAVASELRSAPLAGRGERHRVDGRPAGGGVCHRRPAALRFGSFSALPMAPSAVAGSRSLSRSIPCTTRAPSVSVPVLSKQMVSTLARPSMAGQLLDQHVVPPQPDHTDREGQRGQQDEALRDHADCAGHGRPQSLAERGIGPQLAPHQQRDDRPDDPCDRPQDPVDSVAQLTAHEGESFRLLG